MACPKPVTIVWRKAQTPLPHFDMKAELEEYARGLGLGATFVKTVAVPLRFDSLPSSYCYFPPISVLSTHVFVIVEHTFTLSGLVVLSPSPESNVTDHSSLSVLYCIDFPADSTPPTKNVASKLVLGGIRREPVFGRPPSVHFATTTGSRWC